MLESKELVKVIIEGMQEKKAKRIVTVDMSALDAPCQWFVICEAESNIHTMSIATETKDYVRKHANEKPFASDGYENCQWIALDYGNVMAHVFQPEYREFYDIEHLWEDAVIEKIPDLD